MKVGRVAKRLVARLASSGKHLSVPVLCGE